MRIRDNMFFNYNIKSTFSIYIYNKKIFILALSYLFWLSILLEKSDLEYFISILENSNKHNCVYDDDKYWIELAKKILVDFEAISEEKKRLMDKQIN